jgi:salicylate hydroxylase
MNGKLFNIAIFAHDPSDFAEADKMTAAATREEVERAVAGMSPNITEIAKLFPEKMVKWGIFDMYEDPAPTFNRGLVCIAGDAAHASSPHQGVGACMGVEDALVLCEVLDTAQASLNSRHSKPSHRTASQQALQAFSSTRMERSQWLVRSSREMGEMYQWRYGPTGRDPQRCHVKLEKASRRVWDFDVQKLISDARSFAIAA